MKLNTILRELKNYVNLSCLVTYRRSFINQSSYNICLRRDDRRPQPCGRHWSGCGRSGASRRTCKRNLASYENIPNRYMYSHNLGVTTHLYGKNYLLLHYRDSQNLFTKQQRAGAAH